MMVIVPSSILLQSHQKTITLYSSYALVPVCSVSFGISWLV
ncbi:unnamed protein product [Musa acuminata var. zebrina]